MARLVNKDKLIPDIELTKKEHSELCRTTWVENKVNKTKPDGIHFAPGTVNGLDFPIFLDLSEPDIDGMIRETVDGTFGKKFNKALETLEHKPKVPNPVGRINYKIHNYCAGCKIKYPKGVYRCNNCKSRVRTKPWASNYNRKRNPR